LTLSYGKTANATKAIKLSILIGIADQFHCLVIVCDH
jgi:hypothetical protein